MQKLAFGGVSALAKRAEIGGFATFAAQELRTQAQTTRDALRDQFGSEQTAAALAVIESALRSDGETPVRKVKLYARAQKSGGGFRPVLRLSENGKMRGAIYWQGDLAATAEIGALMAGIVAAKFQARHAGAVRVEIDGAR